MKTVGFVISHKESELRRAILPNDISRYISHPELLYIEEGYGKILGIQDSEYKNVGCNIAKRNIILMQDIICDPKIGDAEYIENLRNQILFGWIHAVQNRVITEKILIGKNTVYAWEDMYENGIHLFFKNNELAGEAAVLHSLLNFGILLENKRVAILGNGSTSKGARTILTKLGADVYIFPKDKEAQFKSQMFNFEIIVNTVLWDISRKDHIITRENISNMKNGTFIIDVSCDKNGAIETSIPTTIKDPIYDVNGVMHYVVDHTPTLLHREATRSISSVVSRFINNLILDKNNETLNKALIIREGQIIDKRIISYQKR